MSDYSSNYESDSDNSSDDRLILTMDLHTISSEQIIHAAKRTATSNFQGRVQYSQQNIDIVASTIYLGGEDDNLRIITASESQLLGPDHSDLKTRERWVHFQTDCIAFEDFERLVINCTLQRHADHLPVVLYLLRKVQEEYEKDSAYGSYIQPGTVLRSDGRDRNHPDKPDLSAIFISFPYFDIGKWRPPDAPKPGSLHLPRGLFQSSYTQEAATDRDGEQMFRKFRGIRADQFLQVPQIWTLVLQSKTVITCGSSALPELFDEHIEFVEEKSLSGHGPSLVQVTDFLGTVTYLPIDHCRTLLGLKQSIEKHCLPETDHKMADCLLHSGNSEEELVSSQWLDLIKAERSVFIYVRLSRKASKNSQSERSAPAGEALTQTNLIEYAGLSSEDSGNDGDGMALMVTRKGNKLSGHAEVIKDRLESQGYVVNDVKSLVVDNSATVGKPKVFRRPLEVDSITWDPKPALVRTAAEQYTDHFAKIQESPSTVRSRNDLNLDDDGASIERPPGENTSVKSDTPQGQKSLVYTGRRISGPNRPNLGTSNSDGRYALGRVIDYEDGKSNAPTRSSQDDLTSQYEHEIFEEVERFSMAQEEGTENGDDEQSDGPSNSSSSKRASPKSLNFSIDGGPPVAKAGILQTRVESVNGDSEPELTSYRSLAYEMADPASESSEAKNKHQLGNNNSPKGSTRLPSDSSSLVENRITPGNDERVADKRRAEKASGRKKKKPLEQVVREEVTAALRGKKDEVDNEVRLRLEGEMRERLARFGFQPNQIEAMVHPENAKTLHQGMPTTNPSLSHVPTYVKVHKDHVAFDTLKYYALPYDIDPQNPDYIIIFREMSREETDVLFSHTRWLRQRSTAFSMEKERESKKAEPVWVRRRDNRQKSKTRRKTFDVVSRGESGDELVAGAPERRRGPALRGARTRKKRTTRTEDQATSPSYMPGTEGVDINTKVPPFFAWPTTLEDDKMTAKDGAGSKDSSSNQQAGALTQFTLSAIAKHIQRQKQDDAQLPVSSHHPFMLSFKSGKAFIDIPEKTIDHLDTGEVPKTNTSEDHDGNQRLCDIRDELAFSNISKNGFTRNACIPSRLVTQWQVSRLCAERNFLVTTAQILIDQFVPKHYPHPLLRKCWGTLSEITKVIADICTENDSLREQESYRKLSLTYVIKDVPDKDYMHTYQLEEFAVPLGDCSVCSRSNLYPDIDGAYQHLQEYHLQRKENCDSNEQRAKLGHWLVSTAGVELERRNTDMMNLIKVLHRRSAKLLHTAVEIRNGVANEQNEKDSNYLLPSALVKAAERIFQFIYTALHTVRFLRDKNQMLTARLLYSTIEVQDNIALAEYYGIAAENELAKAQNELLLMAHTGSSAGSSVVQHISSTPETTVLFALFCVATRRLHQDMGVPGLYRNHLSSLRYGAGQHPSKRILRELYLLQEEVEIIASILLQQYDAIRRLQKVLNSSSYRITDRARINAFERIERPSIERATLHYREIEEEFKKLEHQISKTAQSLRYNIEIAEEGHSKAILVFTLVTIVFLPLSFVATLFGMNTADMRNLRSTQVLFWEVALPLTAVIGGSSLLFAYGGSQIGERFKDVRESIWPARSRTRRRSRLSPTPRARRRDEEEVDIVESTPFPKLSSLKRRRTPVKSFVPKILGRRAFSEKNK